jgi:hypothetical protein
MEPEIVWHPEVLPADAHKTLVELSALPVMKQFYLAGGTALALQWGHRISVDLDFFTPEPFDANVVLGLLLSTVKAQLS